MNPESFGIFGYAGVLLMAAVPLLWLLHRGGRGWRWLPHLALVFALAAFALAKINSLTHVNRIQLDRSAEMAEREAAEEARRQAALDARGDEVAQIRFAEDGGDDFLDRAGMDESDLKYFERLEAGETGVGEEDKGGGEDETPEWKKEKKTRSGGGAPDDSLEAALAGADDGSPEELETAELDGTEEVLDPILMTEPQLAMAHRIDGLNLQLARILIALAVFVVALDYLRRANRYDRAYLPLPLPSAWTNALHPIPPLVVRPDPPRRSVPDELAWLRRRGDSFVYFADDTAAAEAAVTKLEIPTRRRHSTEILRVNGADPQLTDDFVFEALWFGRASFVVDSPQRAEKLLARFVELLDERKATRARVPQTAHLVWDMATTPPEELQEALVRLAGATGISLFLCPQEG